MTCEPTQVPASDSIDLEALRAKYEQERDRRVKPAGQQQYIRPQGDFAGGYEADPYKSIEPRDAKTDEIDVVVLGGGWSGLLSAVHLRKAGVKSFCAIDHAGDFGGVWYWNRYPGLQCDNDAYCYLPMLEEMGFMPSHKFANGWEIYEYIQSIARRFELHENALFHTMVTGLRWDASIKRWRVSTNRGDELLARFVVMANGLLNIPKLPGIPGVEKFSGKIFHTARWDYDYTGGSQQEPVLNKLADKRVAIVGTGATAVQAIPHLSRHAKHLYVLQRTPSNIDARANPETDADWASELPEGWQKERQANFHRAAMEQPIPGEPDLICDFWTEISRNMMAEFEAEGWPELSMEEFMQRRELMDYRVMERARQRIGEIVDDKDTAEALKPWYRFPCKRPLSNNDFYPCFNQDNVTLVDVSATQGVEAMTANGFVADGEQIDIDAMIFASGYEVTSDLDRRWGIEAVEGRDGLSIYEHWADGYQTLHGMMSNGFPNLFFVGMYQGGLNATIPETFNHQGKHIAFIIDRALQDGLELVEPTEQAQNDWVRHIRETAIDISDLQTECTPSYLNNEGETKTGSDGKEHHRWYLGESYGPGWDAFQQILQQWRDAGDLAGLKRE